MQPQGPADPVEERVARFLELVSKTDPEVLAKFNQRFDMSWIYHDSALEGVMYTEEELRAAIDQQVVSDPALLPAYDEIRQHKAAIEHVRDLAGKKKLPITLDTIKDIYCALAPEENETKGPPRYRKEMPVHRLYFHEICVPDKIGPRLPSARTCPPPQGAADAADSAWERNLPLQEVMPVAGGPSDRAKGHL